VSTPTGSSTATEVLVHLDGLIVGPDQWLVLCPREPLTFEDTALLNLQIPEGLRGRVLIACEMTGYVIEKDSFQ
jgi:hypothetical protein